MAVHLCTSTSLTKELLKDILRGRNRMDDNFSCGSCSKTFETICVLHSHCMRHSEGGSYYFDHVTGTAFPKYDSSCSYVQVKPADLDALPLPSKNYPVIAASTLKEVDDTYKNTEYDIIQTGTICPSVSNEYEDCDNTLTVENEINKSDDFGLNGVFESQDKCKDDVLLVAVKNLRKMDNGSVSFEMNKEDAHLFDATAKELMTHIGKFGEEVLNKGTELQLKVPKIANNVQSGHESEYKDRDSNKMPAPTNFTEQQPLEIQYPASSDMAKGQNKQCSSYTDIHVDSSVAFDKNVVAIKEEAVTKNCNDANLISLPNCDDRKQISDCKSKVQSFLSIKPPVHEHNGIRSPASDHMSCGVTIADTNLAETESNSKFKPEEVENNNGVENNNHVENADDLSKESKRKRKSPVDSFCVRSPRPVRKRKTTSKLNDFFYESPKVRSKKVVKDGKDNSSNSKDNVNETRKHDREEHSADSVADHDIINPVEPSRRHSPRVTSKESHSEGQNKRDRHSRRGNKGEQIGESCDSNNSERPAKGDNYEEPHEEESVTKSCEEVQSRGNALQKTSSILMPEFQYQNDTQVENEIIDFDKTFGNKNKDLVSDYGAVIEVNTRTVFKTEDIKERPEQLIHDVDVNMKFSDEYGDCSDVVEEEEEGKIDSSMANSDAATNIKANVELNKVSETAKSKQLVKQKRIEKNPSDKIEVPLYKRKDMKCPTCGKVGTKAMVNYHRQIHSEEMPYTCEVCGKGFKTRACLTAHKRQHGEKKYKCDLCPAAFFRNAYLVAHQRRHTGDLPFVCDLCGDKFKERYILQRHISNVHEGQRNHKCDICGEKFFRSDTRDSHRQRHFEPSLKCFFCSKMFKAELDKRKHELTHTGEKQYFCPLCKVGFSQLWPYYRHMEKKHNMDKESAKKVRVRNSQLVFLRNKNTTYKATPFPDDTGSLDLYQPSATDGPYRMEDSRTLQYDSVKDEGGKTEFDVNMDESMDEGLPVYGEMVGAHSMYSRVGVGSEHQLYSSDSVVGPVSSVVLNECLSGGSSVVAGLDRQTMDGSSGSMVLDVGQIGEQRNIVILNDYGTGDLEEYTKQFSSSEI